MAGMNVPGFGRKWLAAFLMVLCLPACSSKNPNAEDAQGVTTGGDLIIEADGGENIDADGGVGGRNNPVPFGTEAAVGPDWRIKVLSTEPNGNASIQRANQFNDSPPTGGQFFIAKVELSYIGEGSSSPTFEVTLKAVGQGNVTYDPFTNDCGVVPSSLPDNEIFSGGKVSGNVCWSIDSSDADTLLMVADTGLLERNRGFFALK